MITPVFIFSTPRTGSTLLQRILASHQDIATTAEPWILLPLLSLTKKNTNLSNYSTATSNRAIKNFIQKVNENNNYNSHLSNFVLSLYQANSKNNERFFIDKTPRYYNIIEEIIELFPQAKFIFLFRHPAQTFSSVLTTWTNNQFYKLYRNIDDLYLGPKLLSESYQKHQQHSISINYDDLVNDNENTIKKIYKYIGLDNEVIAKFDCDKNHFDTQEMGDPIGKNKYQYISNKSISSWKEIFNSPIRRWLLKSYLKNLGNNVALTHGYSIKQVTEEIDNLPQNQNSTLLNDFIGISYQWLVYKFKLNILFSKQSKLKGFYD